MKILVLDTLIKQTISQNSSKKEDFTPLKSKIPPEAIKRIYEEYRTFAKLEKEGPSSIIEYLRKMQYGRHMEGAEHIFKYRLTDGDRILYTYGKYLPYLKQKEPNSLVLLGYSNHDEQALMARNKNFKNIEKYKKVSDIVNLLDDMSIDIATKEGVDLEDLYTIAELLLDPSSFDNHIKYIVPDEEWATIDIDKLPLKLTDEQGNCIKRYINNPKPTLILGGGGCGKTLIAIHLLTKFNNSKDLKDNVYFTQSKELRQKVSEMYKNIITFDRNNIEIAKVLDINDFVLKELNLTRKNLITTHDFFTFINSDKSLIEDLSKFGISIQDVWAEIRGTIKGSMQSKLTKDVYWQRCSYANQDDFDNLKNINSYIERQKNKKEFVLKYSIEETIKKYEADINLDADDKKILESIIDYFKEFNPQVTALPKDVYLNLSEEESTLEKNNRQFLWRIYEKYSKYCKESNLYDENDIICKMFEKYQNSTLPQFDTVIVDEVQDYTELQLYLLYRMCKDPQGIIFAGDSHQMINPTMFSIKRLRELFYNKESNHLSLNIEFLSKNFRCTEEIINVANNLSEIRRETIGRKEIAEEQKELSIREGSFPFRLNYTKEAIKNLITELMKYPSTVILVADESEKTRLIDLYGKTNYEINKVSKIFTVAEIKGMEYKYVVCFNLFNKYIDIWNSLMQKIVGKKTSKYRYYFNLVYVALTRSQEYLCFIDENINIELENKLKLSYIRDFNQEKLYLTDLTSSDEEWLKEAHEYEKQGKYEEALEIYETYFPDDLDNIYRCEAHIAENNKDYETAIQYYMLINDIEAISILKEDIKNENVSLYKLSNAIINPELITYKKYKKEEILTLINKCFHNKKDADKVKLLVINEFNKYLTNLY